VASGILQGIVVGGVENTEI
jgi:hypothetical protein